jgi:hypothetical protein
MKTWRPARLGAVGLALVTLTFAGCGSSTTETTVLVSHPVPELASSPSGKDGRLPSIRGADSGQPLADGGSVTGGGPAGDPDAVARINAQFPPVPGDITLTDAQALDYIGKLPGLFPGLSTAMTNITKVSRCAAENGIVGARAYIAPDYSRLGAIVVVSQLQSQQILEIAGRCLLHEALGGGGPAGFNPCFDKYSIVDQVNGVTDRYYIFTAGTNAAWCEQVRQFHANFNPQQF